jgi:hemoglobin-like flavoprotein
LNPDASTFFKFTDGYETTDEAMYKQEVFKRHATGVVATVTAAVELLEKGDMDTLTAVLKELGLKHLAHGLQLQRAHYDLVGQALIDTLNTALGDDFSDEVKEAWVGVYDVIAKTMMKGAAEFNNDSSNDDDDNKEEEKKEDSPRYYVEPSTLVVSSWDKVKAIDNYKAVAGQLIFKR